MVYRRIISIFISIVICFSVIPVCRAEYIGTTSGFWSWFFRDAIEASEGIYFLNPFLKGVGAFVSGDICEYSDDSYHYADDLLEIDPSVTDEYGRASATAVCKYCNRVFNCYVSDFEQAYSTQVSELPSSKYLSDGTLIYNPLDYTCNQISLCAASGENLLNQPFSILPYTSSSVTRTSTYSLVSDGALSHIHFEFSSTAPASIPNYVFLSSIVVPISGIYAVYTQPYIAVTLVNHLGVIESCDPSYLRVNNVSSGTYSAGDYLNSYFEMYVSDASYSRYLSGSYLSAQIDYYPATYRVIPSESSVLNIYSVNSRPTSITGDYGIIGDNGQITKVDNTSIVNETNNTYTNPCTGTTSTITEWNYDYSDRSYNVTTQSGDTVTITYGDENVTIQEGDTVYNVYYIVNGDEDSGGDPGVQPSESPTPEACQHEYTSVTDREATCTFSGQVTYTCSLCGHSYTESIPATGHAWDIKETVQTSYDEEGNLLQQGYTIYKCSVCGEEYKDEAGTGPPSSGGGSGSGSGEEGGSIWDKLGNLIGTVFGAIIDFISAIIGKVLDALIALVEMIGDKLGAVVELVLSFFDEIPQLFSGFLAFLTAVFPFLPEEVMLLLTFGIAVIVFIGIIKALRR